MPKVMLFRVSIEYPATRAQHTGHQPGGARDRRCGLCDSLNRRPLPRKKPRQNRAVGHFVQPGCVLVQIFGWQ